MSVADTFRLRFQSLLARGLAASEIAAAVGLGGASEVWGGERPLIAAAAEADGTFLAGPGS